MNPLYSKGLIFEDESAVADRVIYSNNVFGPVESVGSLDPATNEKEIVVLGQTVIVNFITTFSPDTDGFDIIAPDDEVIVSGYSDNDGKIRATYIEGISDPGVTVYEVTGLVKNLDDPTPNTFVINGLTIDYSSIHPEDLPDNFANGLFVEIEGELDDISGNLVADETRLADVVVGEKVEEIEIMGYVTEVLSENGIIQFRIGNQEVLTDGDTVYDPEDLEIEVGVRLEVKGVPNDVDHSVIEADKVSLEVD